MSGNVTPYVDFLTSVDSGENNAASIQPITNGEQMNQTVLQRPDENIRKRLEVLRSIGVDSLFLQNADRKLVIAGPGKVTWPGSTTAGQNGIPVLSDNLWILPMLTPGFAQTAPIPPVASKFGVIHLKRVTGSLDSILVTSARRSYAAGDQINITVTAGGVFSCVLDTEDTGAYRRTIKIVAVAGVTTLSTVITALNGLIPPAPDNTQLVTAALENGAANGDIFLSSQARQFMVGNYDGEGHTITPANLASFFSSNPGSVLAEGDTLCAQFAMLNDTASTGGRRQAIPENSNTTITAGMFFNSRVAPEKLVNALPICKVVNGSLVFSTGAEITAGSANAGLATPDTASRIVRNGGFELGNTTSSGRFQIVDWINRDDLAVNGAWRVNTTTPRSGGKHLELNKTSTTATTARIEQGQEIPVTQNQSIRVVCYVRQLIAPTAGTYTISLNWGDANSDPSSNSTVALQVLSTTDGAYRKVESTVLVPSGKRFLKSISIEVAGVTSGSTGVALLVDDLQIFVETATDATPAADAAAMQVRLLSALVLGDPLTYDVAEEAALIRFTSTTPAGEGKITVEHKSQTATTAPVIEHLGRFINVGSRMLSSASNARFPRYAAPFSGTHAFTLLQEYTNDLGSGIATRIYMSSAGSMVRTTNAVFGGTTWTKDVNGTSAFMTQMDADDISLWHRAADQDTAWTTWTQVNQTMGARQVVQATPATYLPMQEWYDSAGNRRVARDHLGLLRTQNASRIHCCWVGTFTSPASFDFGFAGAVTGTGTVTGDFNGSANRPGAWLKQTVVANTDQARMTAPTLGTGSPAWPANYAIIWECSIDATALQGTPSLVFSMGLKHDAVAALTSEDSICLHKQAASANWKLVTDQSSAPDAQIITDTGIAVSGIQHFRLEAFGSGFPGGQRALLYIDGVCVAQNTTGWPNGQAMNFGSWLTSTGATNQSVYISPVDITMLRAQSDNRL